MSNPEQPDPDVRFPFVPSLNAPANARRAVTPWLSDSDDPICSDVHIAVSEIVSNVVRHTGGGGELRMWDPKPGVPLRLEVEDGDPRLPHSSTPSERAKGGRGLPILDAVTDSWGAFRHGVGKVVWAEFDRHKRGGR